MKNTYRFWAFFLVFNVVHIEASAQSFDEYKRQQQAKYNSYKTKKTEEYRAYRDRVNAEYADYMRKAWTREEVQPAQAVPKRPEPPKPVVRQPMETPQYGAIPFGEVRDLKLPDASKAKPVVPIDELEQLTIDLPENNVNGNDNGDKNGNGNANGNNEPKPKVEPQPKEKPKQETKPQSKVEPQPKEKPKQETKPLPKVEPRPRPKGVPSPSEVKKEDLTFKWCGQTWQVPLEQKHRFSLKSINEADVAEAWKELSGTKYAAVIAACLRVRNEHHLPDWGYLRFLDAMADAFFPGKVSEARLLEMFILVQSGYQARIARADNRLYLLVPSSGEICEYSYLKLGGRKYYVTDKRAKGGQFFVFEREFPREQPFVWCVEKLPELSSGATNRTLQTKSLTASVSIDMGLVEFLDGYPRCNDWNFYALASLSERTKASLYPALRQAMEGKSQKEAVGVLLDFVQRALKYKTDDEQFGAERPLFGDETLYYPYSDCEDRAILFSILVRELVGVKVVLLNYTDHLATAVCMDGNVTGDYLELDGHHYVVCDPTYIGGHVGESMPQYKNMAATVVRI